MENIASLENEYFVMRLFFLPRQATVIAHLRSVLATSVFVSFLPTHLHWPTFGYIISMD